MKDYIKDIEFDSAHGDVISVEVLTTTHIKDEMGLMFVVPQVNENTPISLETIDIEQKLKEFDKKTQEILEEFSDVITQKDFTSDPPNKIQDQFGETDID